MNKWVIIYRVVSINLVLILINVVDSVENQPQRTLDSSSGTTTTKKESSVPTNTDSGTTPSETPANTNNTDPSKSDSTGDGKLSLDKVKLYGKSGDNSSADELKSDQYETEKGSEDYRVYNFSGVKCTEFKYDDKTVWKPLQDKSNKHPSTMIVDISASSVFLYFDDFYCYYEFKDKNWKLKDDLFKDKCYDPCSESSGSNGNGNKKEQETNGSSVSSWTDRIKNFFSSNCCRSSGSS